MNNKTFKIKILTPFSTFLESEITFLSIFSDDFLLGIMPNHAPLVTTVKESDMKITIDNKVTTYHIGKGVMHIKKGGEVLLMLDFISLL